MTDTVQFGRQVPMIQSSLLSPASTTNTKTVTFITYIHRNRLSQFYYALDWSWESILTIFHSLWDGRRRVLISLFFLTSRTSLGSHPAS